MTSVREEIERWYPAPASDAGPGKPLDSPTLSEAEQYCRHLARSHYENFPLVSWLLPARLHQHFYNVYAFCRWADDLGDEIADPQRSLELLGWWREELRSCYAGRMTHPVFIALRSTVDEFALPEQPFADLISAFEQDQTVTSYKTFEQLRDYCRRSADPVGRIVLRLCGADSEENRRLSDSICTGLQLANHWQDVARDLDINRVYLPQEDMRCFSYSESELRGRVTNDAFRALLKFEVDRAETFLRDGLPLVHNMPGRMQIDIDLFARGGLCILDRIRGIGYGVLDTRPVVRKSDALRMLLGSTVRFVFRTLRPRQKH